MESVVAMEKFISYIKLELMFVSPWLAASPNPVPIGSSCLLHPEGWCECPAVGTVSQSSFVTYLGTWANLVSLWVMRQGSSVASEVEVAGPGPEAGGNFTWLMLFSNSASLCTRFRSTCSSVFRTKAILTCCITADLSADHAKTCFIAVLLHSYPCLF